MDDWGAITRRAIAYPIVVCPIVACPSAACLAVACLIIAGCDSADRLTPTETRIEILTADPIAGAGSIVEAVEKINTVDAIEPVESVADASAEDSVDGDASVLAMDDVAVRGRIGVGDTPAFEPDRAAFLMSEIIEDPNAGEGHDVSTCPFCKRRLAKLPRAYVVLVDEAGRELPGPADRLLALQRDEIVQVRGTAQFDPAINTLTVRAVAIHKETPL